VMCVNTLLSKTLSSVCLSSSFLSVYVSRFAYLNHTRSRAREDAAGQSIAGDVCEHITLKDAEHAECVRPPKDQSPAKKRAKHKGKERNVRASRAEAKDGDG
jgi:sRNA-binding protein